MSIAKYKVHLFYLPNLHRVVEGFSFFKENTSFCCIWWVRWRASWRCDDLDLIFYIYTINININLHKKLSKNTSKWIISNWRERSSYSPFGQLRVERVNRNKYWKKLPPILYLCTYNILLIKSINYMGVRVIVGHLG